MSLYWVYRRQLTALSSTASAHFSHLTGIMNREKFTSWRPYPIYIKPLKSHWKNGFINCKFA